jgi:hypothetical protein
MDGSSWNSQAWSGASGQQIGYAGDLPETQAYGFVVDKVHGQAYDPNGPTGAGRKGPDLGMDMPVNIQDDYSDIYAEGMDGWVMDNIPFPARDEKPGTHGHSSTLGPAQSRIPDRAHRKRVFQHGIKAGFGVNFYGSSIDNKEVHAWNSSSKPAPNRGVWPLSNREETANWPEPFDSLTVAVYRPVQLDTERIPMRRISEDDRPVYRYRAVPPQNILPSGSQFTPTYQSNVPVHNVIPLPMMARTPIDPWVTQETASGDNATYSDDPNIFEGWNVG